jgi:hypothetical protein
MLLSELYLWLATAPENAKIIVLLFSIAIVSSLLLKDSRYLSYSLPGKT